MPRYIIKLETKNGPRYMEWSTVVDAPVTVGMSFDVFAEYYMEEYGKQGMHEFHDRIARVDIKGTSDRLADNVETTITPNHAGKDGTHLTIEQLVEFFCDQQCEGDLPVGKSWEELND